jgi:hypothetical protein
MADLALEADDRGQQECHAELAELQPTLTRLWEVGHARLS